MTINSNTAIWVIVAISIVSVAAFSAHLVHAGPHSFGQNHHKMGHGIGAHRLFKMIHHLDLTRGQREKIGVVMDAHRPRMRTFMLDMMDAKKALQNILNDPNYSPAAVENLAKSQAANAESMFLATAATFAEIGSILTPEQRQQISTRMEKRRGWGRRGHGGPDGKASRHHDRDHNGPNEF